VSALPFEQTDPVLQRPALSFASYSRNSFAVAVREFWTDFPGAARIACRNTAAGRIRAVQGPWTDSRSTAWFWSMKN
jgi:hypothetical protein